MANWVNVHLDVRGLPTDIERFRRAAGAKVGRIDTTRSSVFTPEMEHGEGADLEADPLTRFGQAFRTAAYRFQGRYDDHVDHFQVVSKQFPALAFVLAYSDPNCDDHGSYLLLRGRRRQWIVPRAMRDRILRERLARYGLTPDIYDSPAEDCDGLLSAENEAYWEMLEVAARHWETAVLQWLERHTAAAHVKRLVRPAGTRSRSPKRS